VHLPNFTAIAIMQGLSAYIDVDGQISLVLFQLSDPPEEHKPLLFSPHFIALYRNKVELFSALEPLVTLTDREGIDKSLRDKGFASFPISFHGDTGSIQSEAASRLLGHSVEIGPGYVVPDKRFAVQIASMNK